MSLREGDSWLYLKFKQTLVESDHNAVFSNGPVLPVFMRIANGATQLFVEIEYKFFDPRRQPEAQPQVVESPPVESGRLKVESRPGESSFAALKRTAEEQHLKARAERYQANKAQQTGLSAPDTALAVASHQHAQVVAAQKGRRN